MYYCSKCKLSVIVINDKVMKPCKCEASIVAEMKANVINVSKIKA